ncbi:hypothetical protein G3M48_000323 [Beauveria asiatica]|uniref:Uncharacterized protein n=1 Tax=Beauveria asiatica TaxID=1069075 RepID=A0AAW0RGK3_9HYPO
MTPTPSPPPPALLLLPPPPPPSSPSTRLALNSLYHAPLSAVLATLAAQSRQTRRSAPTATASSVDARVVLVNHERGRSYRRRATNKSPHYQAYNSTTVLDLAGFATTAVYADGAVRVRCTVLEDLFGPTVDEELIGAICVSGETRGGGRAVNKKRAAKGWHALDAYEVDVLDTRGIVEDGGGGREEEDFAAKISM